jgi:hypothetical protein
LAKDLLSEQMPTVQTGSQSAYRLTLLNKKSPLTSELQKQAQSSLTTLFTRLHTKQMKQGLLHTGTQTAQADSGQDMQPARQRSQEWDISAAAQSHGTAVSPASVLLMQADGALKSTT